MIEKLKTKRGKVKEGFPLFTEADRNALMFIFLSLIVSFSLVLMWYEPEWTHGRLVEKGKGQETAQFLGYIFGGLLLFSQIFIFNRRVTAMEKGNVAERFKNAIDHLGNDNVSVRLGGIYALHYIAGEVKEYRERVFEILCAHVRETTTIKKYCEIDYKNEPSIEIQSILNLLFVDERHRKLYLKFEANLQGAFLSGSNLHGANLKNADLDFVSLNNVKIFEANLQYAMFSHSDMQNVILSADLEEAKFVATNLQNATFVDANLQEAAFFNAILQGSEFRNVFLQGAYFFEADLQGSEFRNAILQESNFTHANLQGAKFRDVNLQEADFSNSNLQGVKISFSDPIENEELMAEKLMEAYTLYKAIIPDSIKKKIKSNRPQLFKKPSDEWKPL